MIFVGSAISRMNGSLRRAMTDIETFDHGINGHLHAPIVTNETFIVLSDNVQIESWCYAIVLTKDGIRDVLLFEVFKRSIPT
jgi:hypothetical protein